MNEQESTALDEKEIAGLVLQKSNSLGKSQARYSMTAILSALVGFVVWGQDVTTWAMPVIPFLVGFSIMAWFGIGRASSETSRLLKSLIPNYKYGTYGGAPPFIWAIAYAPHSGKRSFQRFLALMSFPVAFSLCLTVAWHIGWVSMGYVCAFLIIPSYQVGKLWVNRIKSV